MWLFGLFYGALRSIRAGFVMFDSLADVFFPDIRRIGVASFADRHPRSRRWLTSGARGRIDRFFSLLPLSDAAGTVYLVVHDGL